MIDQRPTIRKVYARKIRGDVENSDSKKTNGMIE